jgi:hypothetical protein
MSSYEDMRDMQRREEDPDYITPTFAFTADDLAQFEHDHGPDAEEILNEVMERDMARYEKEMQNKMERRIQYLEDLLEENGIEF